MKHISDIIKTDKVHKENENKFSYFSHEQPIDQKTAEVINYIFYRLKGIVTAMKYSVDCLSGLDSIRKEYTYEIRKNNIASLDQINRGIDRIRAKGYKFIPVPAEFVSFCYPSPEDIGAPTIQKAFKEASEKAHPCYGEKKWSHPCVKFAYLETDPYYLRTESRNKTLPVFEKNYLEAIQMYCEGKILDQIEDNPKHNESEKMRRPLTKDERAEYMKSIKYMLR